LTPASGRQDHTTSPSADKALSSAAPSESIASLPYVRDDRETPLCVGRDTNDVEVIWLKRKPKYFCEGGWTGGGETARGQNQPTRPTTSHTTQLSSPAPESS
jgi:hypothetical protein